MKRFVTFTIIIFLTSAVISAETNIKIMGKNQWMAVFTEKSIAFIVEYTDDFLPKFMLPELNLSTMMEGEYIKLIPENKEIILIMEEDLAGEINFTRISPERMRIFYSHIILESDEGGDIVISKGGNLPGSTYLKEQKGYTRLRLKKGFMIYLWLLPPEKGEYYNILHFSEKGDLVFRENLIQRL